MCKYDRGHSGLEELEQFKISLIHILTRRESIFGKILICDIESSSMIQQECSNARNPKSEYWAGASSPHLSMQRYERPFGILMSVDHHRFSYPGCGLQAPISRSDQRRLRFCESSSANSSRNQGITSQEIAEFIECSRKTAASVDRISLMPQSRLKSRRSANEFAANRSAELPASYAILKPVHWLIVESTVKKRTDWYRSGKALEPLARFST